MFKQTHPIIGTRDIQRAIEFYTKQLGFDLAFRDSVDAPNCRISPRRGGAAHAVSVRA